MSALDGVRSSRLSRVYNIDVLWWWFSIVFAHAPSAASRTSEWIDAAKGVA